MERSLAGMKRLLLARHERGSRFPLVTLLLMGGQEREAEYLSRLDRLKALGLDRGDTETLAMDLMGEGALEMVNLSGGVKLTSAGELNVGAGTAEGTGGGDSLEAWLSDLSGAGDLGINAQAAADLEADVACLKAQAGRSQTLPEVIKACLGAAADALVKGNPSALALGRRASSLI